MTTLIVNDQPAIEMNTNGEESVFDVLLAAQDSWGRQSINKLEVNGQVVEPLEEATLMAIPAHEVSIKVSVVPEQARSLDETIAEAIQYLSRLHDGFEEIAPKIRDSNDSEGHKMMKDGLDGLSTIISLVDNLSAREEVPEDLTQAFGQFIEDLQEKSEEMTDAQEGGDPTLIADILEYEFVDSVEELKGLLEKMSSFVV